MKINIKLGGLAKMKKKRNENLKLTDSIIISFVAKLCVLNGEFDL
jgi:hypothetical protein